jgi:hypothetical protein
MHSAGRGQRRAVGPLDPGHRLAGRPQAFDQRLEIGDRPVVDVPQVDVVDVGVLQEAA